MSRTLPFLVLIHLAVFSNAAQLKGPPHNTFRAASDTSSPGAYVRYRLQFIYPGTVKAYVDTGSGIFSQRDHLSFSSAIGASWSGTSPNVNLATWSGHSNTGGKQYSVGFKTWTIRVRWGSASAEPIHTINIPMTDLKGDLTWGGGSGVSLIELDPMELLIVPGTGTHQVNDPYNPDFDGDGIPDDDDWDDDNDGIADENDPNPRRLPGGDPPIIDLPIDPDHDHDGDGTPDRTDPKPDDPLIGAPNIDMDGDGIPNDQDPDRDGDGVRNEHDSDPENPLVWEPPHPDDPDDDTPALDTDGDGIPDYLDNDDDNDGTADVWDPNPKNPPPGGGGTDPGGGPGGGGTNEEGDANGTWDGSGLKPDSGVSKLLQTGGPTMTGQRDAVLGKLSNYQILVSGQVPRATSYTWAANFGKFGSRTLVIDFTRQPFPAVRGTIVLVMTWVMANAFFKRATI